MTDTTTRPDLSTPTPDAPADQAGRASDPLDGSWLAGAQDAPDGAVATPLTMEPPAPDEAALPAPVILPSGEEMVRWSTILSAIPETERLLVIQDYPEAVAKDLVIAVPTGDHAAVRVMGRDGRVSEQTVADELVLLPEDDTALTAWLSAKREATVYALLASNPRAAVDVAYLLDGTLDVRKIHAARKAVFRASDGARSASKPAANKAPAGGRRSPKTQSKRSPRRKV